LVSIAGDLFHHQAIDWAINEGADVINNAAVGGGFLKQAGIYLIKLAIRGVTYHRGW
jgi:hypothetical protein